MDAILYKITGAEELEEWLKALGPTIARRVANNALRAAAKPIVDEARRLCPKDRKRRKGLKTLSQSIRAELTSSGADDAANITIGASRPEGSHSHLIEFGHRIVNQYGEWGFVPPQPFLRPAMDARAAQAIKIMTSAIAKGIEDQARSMAKKIGVK